MVARTGRLPRGRKVGALALLALTSALSAWMITDFATESSGYVAGYTNAAALLVAFGFTLVGLVLLIWRRTRWFGGVSVVCAAWLIASYVVGVNSLYRLDLVSWKRDRMVSLLPGRGTGYYIYFLPGTSEAAIRDFSKDVLFERPSARGQNLKPGIQSYFRVTPHDSREIIAIGLEPILTPAQRRDLRSRIEARSIVSEVADGSLADGKR